MQYTKGRGATSTPEPRAEAGSARSVARETSWMVLARLIACVAAAGLSACGSGSETGFPPSTGGAGGSQPPPGNDASRPDGSTRRWSMTTMVFDLGGAYRC